MSAKDTAQYLMSRGAQGMGLSRAFRALRQNRLVVLNYHGVVPDEYACNPLMYPNVIGVSEFSRQIEQVARFFHPIEVADLRNWRKVGTGRALLVTFDDGYRNILAHAAPVLRRYGVPALVTICPGYVGQRRILWPDEIQWRALWWPEKMIPMPHPEPPREMPEDFAGRLAFANRLRESCKRVPHEYVERYLVQLRQHPVRAMNEEVSAFLSWDEVIALKALGFEVGSHTMEHPILSQLAKDVLIRELRESKRIIEERIGCECTSIAYPNGGAADVSPVVVKEAGNAGYQFAFTVMGGLAAMDDDPLLIDRVYIPGMISGAEFEARISGLHSALRHCLPLRSASGMRQPEPQREVDFLHERNSR